MCSMLLNLLFAFHLKMPNLTLQHSVLWRFAFVRGQTFLFPVLPSTAIAASAGHVSACVTATYFSAVLDVSKSCRRSLLYSFSANKLVR